MPSNVDYGDDRSDSEEFDADGDEEDDLEREI